jgi:hypothetical protein
LIKEEREERVKKRAPMIRERHGFFGPCESRRNMMDATHVGNVFGDGATG